MSPTCQILFLASRLLNLYWILMVVYAVVSWVPSLRGRWSDYLGLVIEPVLGPVRRIIPAMGGLDLSFLIVIVLVSYLSRAIVPGTCYGGY